MDRDDFWAGVRLVVTGLADASKKASYSLGFGAGGLGGALVALKNLGISGPELLLISMSAFFIAARVGKAFDERFDRALLTANFENNLKLQQRIKGIDYNHLPRLGELQYHLSLIVREESLAQREQMYKEIEREFDEITHELTYKKTKRISEYSQVFDRLEDLQDRLRQIVREESPIQREQMYRRIMPKLHEIIYLFRVRS